MFVFVISKLFAIELAPGHPGHPEAVLPSGLLMIVAMVCGVLLYKKGWPLLPVALAGFAISRLRAGSSSVRGSRALLWVGAAIVGGLVVVDALAIWVEWHGDRCIGPCGDAVWPPS